MSNRRLCPEKMLTTVQYPWGRGIQSNGFSEGRADLFHMLNFSRVASLVLSLDPINVIVCLHNVHSSGGHRWKANISPFTELTSCFKSRKIETVLGYHGDRLTAESNETNGSLCLISANIKLKSTTENNFLKNRIFWWTISHKTSQKHIQIYSILF